jgi:small subunit ribosomal protein S18
MQSLQKKCLYGFNNKQNIKSSTVSAQALPGQKKRSWTGQRSTKKGVFTPRGAVNNMSKTRQKKSSQGNVKVVSQTRIKGKQNSLNTKQIKSNLKVLSLSQLLAGLRQERQEKVDKQKRPTQVKPIIPPKAFVIVLTEKPKKIVYNRRIIDYKHCGLLQRYLGLGGKILPRRQTRLTAKQQRFVAKAIKSARVMGLLPFVSKERGFFR